MERPEICPVLLLYAPCGLGFMKVTAAACQWAAPVCMGPSALPGACYSANGKAQLSRQVPEASIGGEVKRGLWATGIANSGSTPHHQEASPLLRCNPLIVCHADEGSIFSRLHNSFLGDICFLRQHDKRCGRGSSAQYDANLKSQASKPVSLVLRSFTARPGLLFLRKGRALKEKY